MKSYLLDENKQPYEVSIEEAVKLYKDIDMKITKQDRISDDVRVSTVFLGFDHGWYSDRDNPNYKPVLWETMIFGGINDGYQERYTSHEDALKGHQYALDLVKSKLTNDGNNPTEISS